MAIYRGGCATKKCSTMLIGLELKSESKKIGHFLLLIIWYWEPSEYFWIKKGQNDLFQAFKWGVVCLSTSNSFRDMTKRNDSIIFNFHD